MVVIKETLDASIVETETGEIRLNQYQIHDVIGSGSFGTVSLAVDLQTKQKYAIKEFSKNRLRKKNQSNLLRGVGRSASRGRAGIFNIRAARIKAGQSDNPMDLIKGELAVLKKLNHPNVVKLFEVLDNPNDDMLYMVFEICDKGPILNVSITEKFKHLTEEESRKLFRQIVLGVEYLHENGIAHRDIKPDNLLLSSNGTIKIVDFGVSEMFSKDNDRLKSSAGSPAFMAPELGKESVAGFSAKAVDVWAMGVTLFAMVFGYLPFQGENIIELKDNIQEKPVAIPESTSPHLKDLLEKLLDKDPLTRIQIEQMRDHPWITNEGKDPLISVDENCHNMVLELSEEEVNGAIRHYGSVFKVVHAVYKFKQLRAKSKSQDKSNENSPVNSPQGSALSLPVLDGPQVRSPLSAPAELDEDGKEGK